MKTKITLLFIATIAMLSFTSCFKEDAATTRELDGEWTLTSGSGTMINKNFESDGDLYSTTTTEVTLDGKTLSGTSTLNYVNAAMDDEISEFESNITISIKFDRKAGTYEKTTVTTETDKYSSTNYIVNPVTQGSYLSESFDVIDVNTETEVEKGDFTLNQKSGDIAKGTQIILASTSISTTNSSVKSYYLEGETSEYEGTLYTYDFWDSEYTSVKKESTSTTTQTSDKYNESQVWTIKESTKDALKVTASTSFYSITTTGIVESNKHESSDEMEYVFSKK